MWNANYKGWGLSTESKSAGISAISPSFTNKERTIFFNSGNRTVKIVFTVRIYPIVRVRNLIKYI